MLSPDDPTVVSLTELIRAGDITGLTELLTAHPSLALERFGDAATSCTALHVATDWPGHRPSVENHCCADGRRRHGRRTLRRPASRAALHRAASSNDIEAIDALLDAGADIEVDGAVLTGGTPLADAVVFAQWDAARRLVERNATMTIWPGRRARARDRVRPTPRLRHPHRARHHQRLLARVPGRPTADSPATGGPRGRRRLARVRQPDPRKAGIASGSEDLAGWLLGL